LHRQPKQRAAACILASLIELSGTFGKRAFQPGRSSTWKNRKPPGAIHPDVECPRDGTSATSVKMFMLAAVALAIEPAEQQSKEGSSCECIAACVHRMAQVAEDRTGMLQAMADGAKELAA